MSSSLFSSQTDSSEEFIKRNVTERAGGFCECDFESHGHRGGVHGESFDTFEDEPQFVIRDTALGKSISNVILVCPPCGKKIRASRKRIR